MATSKHRDARQVIRAVLAADFSCMEHAFLDDGLVITCAAEQSGRRRFPWRSKPLGIATMGAGVVVSCHPERVDWLRTNLGELHRDAIFSATTIARLAQYIEPDGQLLSGPDLKYVCSQGDLRQAEVPEHVEIAVVEGTDIPQLHRHRGFPHALSYRTDTPRPDVLATVATRADEIVGIAGASADGDAMWQIGVDVVAHAWGGGIGRALVSRLTQEVLRQGCLPYYSTIVSNLRSSRLALSLGYWLAWVELYARDRQPVG